MYQALYRKWRPQTFDEICGQQHITKILRMQCEENRVAHAYLFYGTRGTGKTSTAKILAKAINCETPVHGNPCNHCYACTSIDAGTATDVVEIDAASNNGVDDIRNLRDEVVYPPSVLNKRVYIIDEVHMLSAGAFNALLKTLEEPPAYIVFILATTELNKLPATIISRCIRFDFNRLREELIADRIRYVSDQENIRLGDGTAELLAQLADGALRDGLSILEACTSGVGAEYEITVQSVRDRLGLADAQQLLAYYQAVAMKDIPGALSILEEVHRSSKDISVFLEDIAALSRDLLLLRQLKDQSRQYHGTFRFRREAELLLRTFPDIFTTASLFFFCSVLEETQSRMTRYATDKKILLEFATIRLCDLSLSDSPQALVARVSRLEKRLANSTPTATICQEELPAKHTEEKSVSHSPAVPSATFTQYEDLVEEMINHPDLLPYIRKIQIAEETETYVIYADTFTLRMLQLGNNSGILSEAIQTVTGKAYPLRFCEQTQAPIQNHHAFIDELS